MLDNIGFNGAKEDGLFLVKVAEIFLGTSKSIKRFKIVKEILKYLSRIDVDGFHAIRSC